MSGDDVGEYLPGRIVSCKLFCCVNCTGGGMWGASGDCVVSFNMCVFTFESACIANVLLKARLVLAEVVP